MSADEDFEPIFERAPEPFEDPFGRSLEHVKAVCVGLTRCADLPAALAAARALTAGAIVDTGARLLTSTSSQPVPSDEMPDSKSSSCSSTADPSRVLVAMDCKAKVGEITDAVRVVFKSSFSESVDVVVSFILLTRQARSVVVDALAAPPSAPFNSSPSPASASASPPAETETGADGDASDPWGDLASTTAQRIHTVTHMSVFKDVDVALWSKAVAVLPAFKPRTAKSAAVTQSVAQSAAHSAAGVEVLFWTEEEAPFGDSNGVADSASLAADSDAEAKADAFAGAGSGAGVGAAGTDAPVDGAIVDGETAPGAAAMATLGVRAQRRVVERDGEGLGQGLGARADDEAEEERRRQALMPDRRRSPAARGSAGRGRGRVGSCGAQRAGGAGEGDGDEDVRATARDGVDADGDVAAAGSADDVHPEDTLEDPFDNEDDVLGRRNAATSTGGMVNDIAATVRTQRRLAQAQRRGAAAGEGEAEGERTTSTTTSMEDEANAVTWPAAVGDCCVS